MQNKLMSSTIVGNTAVRLSAANIPVGPQAGRKPQPEIHVQQEAGRIKSLVITCACGEKITLICDYAEKVE